MNPPPQNGAERAIGSLPPQTESSLSKKDVLDAISYEISEREGRLNRRGFSEWTLKGAMVALLWGLLTGSSSAEFSTSNVCLVVVCSWVLLSWVELASAGTENESQFPIGTRSVSHVFRDLVRPKALLFQAVACIGILLCLPLLWEMGHRAFSITLGLGTVVMLAIVSVGGIAMLVKLPLGISGHSASIRSQPELSQIVFVGGQTLVSALAINTLMSAWSSLVQAEIKNGVFVAAALKVFELMISTYPSTALAELRSLRKRLLLGKLSTASANDEFERIVLGPSADDVIGSKEVEVSRTIGERTEKFELANSFAAEVHRVAGEIRNGGEGAMLSDDQSRWLTSEERRAVDALKRVREIDDYLPRQCSRLSSRLKVAALLGIITKEKEEEIRTRNRGAIERMIHVQTHFFGQKKEFMSDLKLIKERRRAASGKSDTQPMLTGAEVFAAFFRE